MARSKTSDRSAKPALRLLSAQARKTALARFARRTADLFLGYVVAGRSTPKLSRAVRKLKDDIDSWCDLWGRKHIRATATTKTQKGGGSGEWTCKNCEWVMVSLGRLCFLVGCDPEYKECDYVCIDLPRDPDFPVG
jgi:hypothetical protein